MVNQPRQLYVWDADRNRRFVCVAEAPFDDDGEDFICELPRQGALSSAST